MEALRPRSRDYSPLIELDEDEERAELMLPSPPAPFPADLLERGLPSAVQSRGIYETIFAIQQPCVQVLSSMLLDPSSSRSVELSSDDRRLATALSDLIEASYELESLRPSSSSSDPSLNGSIPLQTPVSAEQAYDSLVSHLEALQAATHMRPQTVDHTSPSHPATQLMCEEPVWGQMEALSAAVLKMIRTRSPPLGVRNLTGVGLHSSISTADDAPPSYTMNGTSDHMVDHHSLPSYEAEEESLLSTRKTQGNRHVLSPSSSYPSASREKMLRELDHVSGAIERLQAVNPRLQNQRVEMKTSTSQSKGQAASRLRRDKMRELEDIWEKIERAHRRKGVVWDQRHGKDDWEKGKVERRRKSAGDLLDRGEDSRVDFQDSAVGGVDAEPAEVRDSRNDLFLRDLEWRSGNGRLADQDVEASADGPTSGVRLHTQQAFLADLIAHTRAGRMSGQDYSYPVNSRLAQKREGLMDHSPTDRLHEQDDLPPASASKLEPLEDPLELVTVEDFLRTRRRSLADSSQANGEGSGGSHVLPNSPPHVDGDMKKSPAAFKRFAGMMRRGSQGLGLKTSNGLDLANLAYVAEHQENLNAIQIMLHGVGLPMKDDFAVETTSSPGRESHDAIVKCKRDPAQSTHIIMPVPVRPMQTATLIPQNLHLEGKLSALPGPTSTSIPSLNNAHTHALSATDLRREKPRGVCCAVCDHEVADLSAVLRQEIEREGAGFKDLPSEHWAEMMDVWMCHDDPGFTAKLAERTRDGYWPTKTTVLVGGSYLLLHPENTKLANVRAENGHTKGWNALSCTCGEALGKVKVDDGKAGAGTVKLAKWAIALQGDGAHGRNAEPLRFPLCVFVVSDMLELAQAHASYRFIIAEEETDNHHLLLWIFNPSVRISYRKIPGSPTPSPLRISPTSMHSTSTTSSQSPGTGTAALQAPVTRSIRAIKVFYKILGPDESQISEDLPGFGPSGQVETLSYPQNVCSRLIAVLQESTFIYPVARRTMGAFDAGFLERV